MYYKFFFFSSRRRHTRWPRDWSSTCALPILFLDATLTNSQADFCQGVGRALLEGPYQPHPQVDVTALHQLAQRWVRQHKRPRTPSNPSAKASPVQEQAGGING